MTGPGFVHLRVHSAFSLLEGMIRIKDLVRFCRDQGMPAVALTDTGNLFGGLEFSTAAAEAGVQPIVGCQFALARAPARDAPLRRPHHRGGEEGDAIVLLAKDETGYRNLLALLAKANERAGTDARPHLRQEDLAAANEGLLLLTGGAAGPVDRLILEGKPAEAGRLLEELAAIFPERLYAEVQRHGLPDEERAEAGLIEIAYRLGVPLVATNEAFFPTADDYEAHDALLCVAGGTYVSERERRRLTPEHRLKSAAEMRALFADLPEAVDNTLIIARRCAFMPTARKPILPPFPVQDGRSEEEALRALAEEGLEKRLESQVFKPGDEREAKARPYRERLKYELDVIVGMGFTGYFLIVADFIRWTKAEGIPVGPGRGSGAGSVVAWALTITDLDPLRFGLLFERFLNPERVSMPDFDIDFCRDRRDAVIHYVRDRYGADRVAQIITFGTLQARAVLRDVGRVLEMPYSQVDRVAKLVPNNPAAPVTLEQAIAGEPQLKEMIAADAAVARLVAVAKRLEGLYRHASTHAAGVVIGDRPLQELIPLYRDPRSETLVTGFNMKYVELAGLVKFDFLGLKTLTVLAKAAELTAARGHPVELDALPLDDEATFRMLAHGDSTGVFQLEGAGMRDVLRKLRPDTFEDIIAVVALYRPGPMDNIPSYIRRKHGEEAPDYLYPTLEGILKETFGIIIYQEQVMQIAQELAGYSLGGADLLRRAMGKKIKAEMDKQRATFVDGAVAKGVPKDRAVEIFELVAKFAGYGFNKSHAAAYALVAYQTAWFKANRPVEFFAASMTLDLANTDKLAGFRQELDRLGIPLLPPDVNASAVEFSVGTDAAGRPGIRYALAAVRNVGEAAMRTLVAERERGGPFCDLDDFARRIDPKALNRRQLENLVRAGALDPLEPNRRQTFEAIEDILREAGSAAQDRTSDQIGLFGGPGGAAQPARRKRPAVADWLPMDRLREEFDALGFYLSSHPLDAYGRTLKRLKVKRIAELMADGRSGPVNLAGTVIGKKERTSGRGNRFAFVQLSDTSGMFEVTVFSEQLSLARDHLEVGGSLFVKASAQFEGESVRLTANQIEPLDAVAQRTASGLRIRLDDGAAIEPVKALLAQGGRGAGGGPILLVARIAPETEVEIELPGKYALPVQAMQALRATRGVIEVGEA